VLQSDWRTFSSMESMQWFDRSVLEASSWRLASELLRRHPKTLRLIRAHPGGGQSDCLLLLPTAGGRGDVRLNRAGTIQVLERFDGAETSEWRPTEWDEYLRADPREFLLRLEAAAGLTAPAQVPTATPTTLTCRLLAAFASTAVKSVHPIEIDLGYIDTSGGGGGGGPNRALGAFSAVPADLLRPMADDFFGEPGYRFWIVLRDGAPVLAFEHQAGLGFTLHGDGPIHLMKLYEKSHRRLLLTALTLLGKVDKA
jgi:hypothetical protein